MIISVDQAVKISKVYQQLLQHLMQHSFYYPELMTHYFDHMRESGQAILLPKFIDFFRSLFIEYHYKLNFCYALMDYDYSTANDFLKSIDIDKIQSHSTRKMFHVAKAEVLLNIEGRFSALQYLNGCEFKGTSEVLDSVQLIQSSS